MQRGAGSLEYLGVVAVVAVLVGALVLGFVNSHYGENLSAQLCKLTSAVGGGSCPVPPEERAPEDPRAAPSPPPDLLERRGQVVVGHDDQLVGERHPGLAPDGAGLPRHVADRLLVEGDAGADEVAVFTAASEAFNRKNVNASIDESIDRFRPVLERARADGVRVRGYVSTVLGCPYQGEVPVADVVRVAGTLHALGCYEVSLGDTIGIGTPGKARSCGAVSMVGGWLIIRQSPIGSGPPLQRTTCSNTQWSISGHVLD